MKIPLGRSSCKCEDNIKIYLTEAGVENFRLRIVTNFGLV
jgi:hypothetical protein